MSTPAILILIVSGIGLLLHARDHGKPKTGVHNFWIGLIASALMLGLLAWGGFFEPYFMIGGG